MCKLSRGSAALGLSILAAAMPVSAECLATTAHLDDNGELIRPYEERTLQTRAGDTRKWLLRLPDNFDPARRANVVFSFHGATSNADAQYRLGNFDELADRDHVILVMPDANIPYPDREHEIAEYWDNAWEGKWRTRDVDIDFAHELVEVLRSDYCAGRFFAAGMSAGGDMTTALQCELETPFAAFAPVTYRYYEAEDCAAAPPRPVLSFHGDKDLVVPMEGLDAPWFDASVPEIMQDWAEHNGCATTAQEKRISAEVVHYSWKDCDAPVEWYLVEGGGHTWPGSVDVPFLGHTTKDIDASSLIWSFFFGDD